MEAGAAGAVMSEVAAGAGAMLVSAALVAIVVVSRRGRRIGGRGGGVVGALLQPTNAKGRAKVSAARREYFCRRLFMEAFNRRAGGV